MNDSILHLENFLKSRVNSRMSFLIHYDQAVINLLEPDEEQFLKQYVNNLREKTLIELYGVLERIEKIELRIENTLASNQNKLV